MERYSAVYRTDSMGHRDVVLGAFLASDGSHSISNAGPLRQCPEVVDISMWTAQARWAPGTCRNCVSDRNASGFTANTGVLGVFSSPQKTRLHIYGSFRHGYHFSRHYQNDHSI